MKEEAEPRRTYGRANWLPKWLPSDFQAGSQVPLAL